MFLFIFFIVGAGTSGSVIAHHLSQPKYDFSVLLLEAGGDPIPLTKIPALFTAVHSSPRMNYAYKTVPQTDTCLGLNSRQSYWPQGKGLGGTSNINALIWTKGHDKDYDNWANITGDSRWNSTNLLKYFKNTETKVTKAESELGKKLIEAAMELGYPHVNTNEPYKEGTRVH
jgi:choline dehydrogenase